MSYLENIPWPEGQSMGGISTEVKVLRVDDLENDPKPIGDTILDSFETTASPVSWKVSTNVAGSKTKSKQVREGSSHHTTLSFSIPGDMPTRRNMLQRCTEDEFIVFFRDNKGYERVFGTKNMPVSFKYELQTGNQSQEWNGYNCEFYINGALNVEFFIPTSINSDEIIMTEVGRVVQYVGTTPPAGITPLDGGQRSRTGTFQALFNHIGTTFGIGDGSTTFNVPLKPDEKTNIDQSQHSYQLWLDAGNTGTYEDFGIYLEGLVGDQVIHYGIIY